MLRKIKVTAAIKTTNLSVIGQNFICFTTISIKTQNVNVIMPTKGYRAKAPNCHCLEFGHNISQGFQLMENCS